MVRRLENHGAGSLAAPRRTDHMHQPAPTSSRLLGALLAGLTALAASAAEPTAQAAAGPAPAALPAPPLAAPQVATVAAAPAAASTLDEQARFLAGLPVPASSPLAAWQSTRDYADHVALMNSEWKKLSDRLDRAVAWQ